MFSLLFTKKNLNKNYTPLKITLKTKNTVKDKKKFYLKFKNNKNII